MLITGSDFVPFQLAQAGFYFTGSKEEPDSVTCFFCEKCLDGWEPNDNPWKEHINHSRECTFAKMQKPEADWTYAEFLDLRDELLRRLIKKACDQSLEQFDNMVEAHKKLMKTYD